MSPSLNSFGSNPSVSQLVWDTDLVIPDGYSIESASGEVGIVGDMSVSGSIAAEDTVHGVDEVSTALLTATNADITTLSVTGYTPTLVQSSRNTFTYNGAGGNVFIAIPTIPAGGVSVNGTATIKNTSWNIAGGDEVSVYATCMSFGGKIDDVELASIYKPIEQNVTLTINAKIPASTQYLSRLYVTSTSSYNQPSITAMNFTSAAYTTKLLI